MAEPIVVTPEGLKKLQDELEYLKSTKRKENVEAIRVALSFGDLSENAEYDEARNEQAKTEARIKELEELVANAVVVDETKLDTSVVSLGSLVTVYDVEEDEEITYSISCKHMRCRRNFQFYKSLQDGALLFYTQGRKCSYKGSDVQNICTGT